MLFVPLVLAAVTPTFTSLEGQTPEEAAEQVFQTDREGTPEKRMGRILEQLKELKDYTLGSPIDLLEHSVQTATRAFRDGADNETVVVGLLHDLGELIVPVNHGGIPAAILRPYISHANHWAVLHHEVFQAYHYGGNMGLSQKAINAREMYKESPHYEHTKHFCKYWDQASFDPNYKSESLDFFKPMLLEVLSREPYSHKDHASCPTSVGKAIILDAYLTK